MQRKILLTLSALLLLALIALSACQSAPPATVEVTRIIETTRVVEVTREVPVTVEVTVEVTPEPITYAQETALQPIPLADPLGDRHAEISSMAWYGDNLIIVPQYPNFFLDDKTDPGALFAIPKSAIAAYLNKESCEPLEAKQIPLDAGDAYNIPGFEGFEAIAFKGDTVYMTIEVSGDDGMYAYLVSGKIAPDLSGITLDTDKMVKIPTQSGVDNMSEEAIIVTDDSVITFHEANGVAVNPKPVAHVFGLDLSDKGTIPMPNVEYRITDATTPDDNGVFWVINYFWPGEEVLKPEVDPIFEKYGKGPTHAASEGVERLLALQYTKDGIQIVDIPPIQLQLMADGSLRNLEAIARWDDQGFLVATDKYPTTIFGFVPLPKEEDK